MIIPSSSKPHQTCRHVALIPDGNRRWAKHNNVPILVGHQRGYERIREFIAFAKASSVEVVTVWAFSTENWKREASEVTDLMNLVGRALSQIHEDAKKEKARVVHIGRRDRMDAKLIALLEKVEEETKMYTGFCLCLAIDYGGEDEIERAGVLLKDSLDKDKTMQDFLDTTRASIPPLDLVIRTGGEKRTSGFMPLQSTYAEWIFEEKLLPDFDTEACKGAFSEFASRVRRFGK